MGSSGFEMRYWGGMAPEEGGYPGFNPRTEAKGSILCHYDVAVAMRDGKKIFVDIFRPEQERGDLFEWQL